MMLTILYENVTYTLPNKANRVHLPCSKHLHCVYFRPDASFCISTYVPASYRIANRESSHRTRGARRAARGAATGGARGWQGGRWGAFGVPRSPSEFLRERQAPEHFPPWFANILINVLLWLIHYVHELSTTVAALYLVHLCYTISLLPWYS
jgi:hypothetical protein